MGTRDKWYGEETGGGEEGEQVDVGVGKEVRQRGRKGGGKRRGRGMGRKRN